MDEQPRPAGYRKTRNNDRGHGETATPLISGHGSAMRNFTRRLADALGIWRTQMRRKLFRRAILGLVFPFFLTFTLGCKGSWSYVPGTGLLYRTPEQLELEQQKIEENGI